MEQDHRFIKRLVKPGLGCFSFETASRTLQGGEIMPMRRKGQVHGIDKGDTKGQISFIAQRFGVTVYTEEEECFTLFCLSSDFCNKASPSAAALILQGAEFTQVSSLAGSMIRRTRLRLPISRS